MSSRQLSALGLLAAVWGGSFLFIRVAVRSLGAVWLTDVRLLVAAGVLGLYLLARRERLRLARPWLHYVGLGAVNAAAPFMLIAIAETRIDAGLAAIVNASTPLFSALVAAVWLREALTRGAGAGLVLGIAGVAVVVGLAPQHFDLAFFAACLASLAAALGYGIGANVAKRFFREDGPAALSLAQLAGAGVLLVPALAPFPPHDHSPPAKAILCLAALAVLGTAAAYIVYFRLIEQVGATKTLTVTMLVPVFGVLWSALFLGERVTFGTVLGGAMILASVSLVTGWRPARRVAPQAEPHP